MVISYRLSAPSGQRNAEAFVSFSQIWKNGLNAFFLVLTKGDLRRWWCRSEKNRCRFWRSLQSICSRSKSRLLGHGQESTSSWYFQRISAKLKHGGLSKGYGWRAAEIDKNATSRYLRGISGLGIKLSPILTRFVTSKHLTPRYTFDNHKLFNFFSRLTLSRMHSNPASILAEDELFGIGL